MMCFYGSVSKAETFLEVKGNFLGCTQYLSKCKWYFCIKNFRHHRLGINLRRQLRLACMSSDFVVIFLACNMWWRITGKCTWDIAWLERGWIAFLISTSSVNRGL